ncbi:MAG TPA: exo-alpha-sialidase, partial [Candidatus Acidoferrum sp.]|nr:exo-alpha-sialidase [Candidatus Acidoferrum sp.]
MSRTGARWLLIAVAVALNVLPLLRKADQASCPSLAPESPAHAPLDAQSPFFTNELINPGSPRPMSHVASICELPDGRLAAAWYAGSREGATDVAICFAAQQPGASAWTRPRPLISPARASRDLHRAVRKVGNPVIFSDAAGNLSLLYVTITLGGWSGSSLNLTTSADAGLTWSPSRRLTLSPFFNLSELVRNRPLALSDGGTLVPIYHEFIGKFPELLWLGDRS